MFQPNCPGSIALNVELDILWRNQVRERKMILQTFTDGLLKKIIQLNKMKQNWFTKFMIKIGFLRENVRVQAAREILKGRELISR